MADANLSATPPETNGGSGGLPRNIDELNTKRRGVKPGQKRGSYSKSPNGSSAAATVEVAAPAFTPESVRPVVSLPFNLAFVRTGFDGFLLSDLEAENLSHSGAMLFNQWVQVDPKYLALITFSLALASISVQKTMHYRKALAEFQAEQERKKKEAEGKPNG